MRKGAIYTIVFYIWLMVGSVEAQDLAMLLGDNLSSKLIYLERKSDAKAIERMIVETNAKAGELLIQAGFAADNEVFYLIRSNVDGGQKYSLELYNTQTTHRSEMFAMKSDWDGIRIIAMRNGSIVFRSVLEKNIIKSMNPTDQVEKTLAELPKNADIVDLGILTNMDILVHAELDQALKTIIVKRSSGSTYGDYNGWIYGGDVGHDYSLKYLDDQISLVDNKFAVSANIKAPNGKGFQFYKAVALGYSSFILCFRKENKDFLADFLFGAKVPHTKFRFEYWKYSISHSSGEAGTFEKIDLPAQFSKFELLGDLPPKFIQPEL